MRFYHVLVLSRCQRLAKVVCGARASSVLRFLCKKQATKVFAEQVPALCWGYVLCCVRCARCVRYREPEDVLIALPLFLIVFYCCPWWNEKHTNLFTPVLDCFSLLPFDGIKKTHKASPGIPPVSSPSNLPRLHPSRDSPVLVLVCGFATSVPDHWGYLRWCVFVNVFFQKWVRPIDNGFTSLFKGTPRLFCSLLRLFKGSRFTSLF